MKTKNWKKMSGGSSGGGAVYCLGLLGALIYFIQNATSLGEGLLGIIKAIVWPAFVVHGLLGFLKL